MQKWTIRDVGDWLKRLGLNDYIQKFKENHINGQVLFELTEVDLKDEFNMTSLGHRKSFVRAVENLKRIYCDETGKNSDYVRQKIQKFYERNRSGSGRTLLGGGTLRSREGLFYSHRLLSRNNLNSQYETIEEVEELNPKTETQASPKLAVKKESSESKDDLKLSEKHGSPTLKKSLNPEAEFEMEMESIEDLSGLRQSDGCIRGSKKTLNKLSSESQKSSPSKEDPTLHKADFTKAVEESKAHSPRSKKNGKESSNSQGSSTDPSTDSELSDHEKTKESPHVKKAREGSLVLDVPETKLERAKSKIEKKVLKKKPNNASHNFKSAEFPVVSRTNSKGFGDDKVDRKRNTQRKNHALLMSNFFRKEQTERENK